jgi:uncharacterized protein involved in tolerance to divalent cations
MAKEEIFGISMYDLMILYANVYMANKHPDIGYVDYEVPFRSLEARLRKAGTQIKQSELESAFWACIMMSESGKPGFWHPNNVKVKEFVNSIIHYKQMSKYYDEIYSQIKEKKRPGRPTKE